VELVEESAGELDWVPVPVPVLVEELVEELAVEVDWVEEPEEVSGEVWVLVVG